MNYETIKGMAKANGLTVKDLIALAPQNDPFYAGTPTEWANAEWFAGLWQTFGYTQGVHIRRVHYQIISQDPPVLMTNGEPYENTETCWTYLNQASKMARYLELIDPGAFVDRRNPDPHIFKPQQAEAPSLWLGGDTEGVTFPEFPQLPGYGIEGYTGTQPYHLEIWCEKSTMNDVLLPLCEQYGVNLVTGVGEMSITACLQLAGRFTTQPVRIFYISDFDPAGQSMPVAVSRKVEYFQRNKGYAADVRLYPLILTLEQVRGYRLPRTPIKETERRRGAFADRYGEGAVELDALEALYPGELATVVSRELDHYYDHDLPQRVEDAEAKLRRDLDELQQAITARHVDEIEALHKEYRAIRSDFKQRFRGFSTRVNGLWQAITNELEENAPYLDAYPVPAGLPTIDRGGALYDSAQDYLAQIQTYKEFQGKQ